MIAFPPIRSEREGREGSGMGRNEEKTAGVGTGEARRPGRHRLFRLMSFYPPYLGAGVKITHVAPDLGTFEVRMRLTRWNRNYLGTHFGGSLYSMCDPFFVLILAENLGPGYVVWDKAAGIRFRRPGRGTVTARFHIPPATIADIRAAADRGETVEPTFTAQVLDTEGRVVAEVDKLLYIRRRGDREPAPAR
jgi:acyl-coenzyme A thioesterase PaaI-like protein